METRPFQIAIEQPVLDDLRSRLERRRRPQLVNHEGWELGTSSTYLEELLTYWRDGFDWRAREAELNRLPQFIATRDRAQLHYVHTGERGATGMPLLLLHGWPDSFVRYQQVIPRLGRFPLVIPSLPGTGFSTQLPDADRERPLRQTASLLRALMTDVLGYRRFGVVGGDTGAAIAQAMAIQFPENVAAIHITELGWHATKIDPATASREEHRYLAAASKQFMQDGAYVALQTTRPHSLSPALTDSPAGLASWIVDRFHSWSGVIDDQLTGFTKDQLLTNLTLYWVTGTIGSSMATYRDEARSPSLGASDRVTVPVAVALFPHDINGIPPRSLAERTLNVTRWTEMPRGGHFAAMEQPALFAEDVAAFFAQLEPAREGLGLGEMRR